MNGLTLVEKVSGLGEDLPVLYMSGYVQGEVTWPGVPGAETAFLQKPVDVEELDRTVRDLLARGSGGGGSRVASPSHGGAEEGREATVGERKGSV
jgi:DNA-binding NtrC family response regulator